MIEAEAQAVLVKHARSFRFAQLFLGPRARRESAIAYAFCRLVDDAVDEAPSNARAREDLDAIEKSLKTPSLTDALIAAYQSLAQRRRFGLEPAFQLILGARSDLEDVRVADDEELLTYCYRVAGTVGEMMSGILGVTAPEARRHAVDLGIAMQLTNICRDVREDAARGRVYLPRRRLAEVGVDAESLLDVHRLDQDIELRRAVARVIRDLLDRADCYYASGEDGLRFIPVRARLAIAVASRVYGGIGRKLRRRFDGDPGVGRVRVSTLGKLWLSCGAVGVWLASLVRRAPMTERAALAERSPERSFR